jgi:hypothetical protein
MIARVLVTLDPGIATGRLGPLGVFVVTSPVIDCAICHAPSTEASIVARHPR